MNLVKRMAASAVVLAGLSGAAFAQNPAIPGAGTVPVPVIGPAVGTQLQTLSSTYAGTNAGQAISGTILSAAYDRGGGLLDFWYQIITDVPNAGSNNSSVVGVSLASFITTVSTSVAQTADGDGAGGPFFSSGTAASTGARRDGTGESITFDFTAPASTTTFTFLVRTDSTVIVTGQAGILGGGVGANAAVLTPQTPGTQAPEPASVGLLALGSVAMGALVARRRK
jgi:hypothetical protein